MPTPIEVFARIAEKFGGVDPDDESAVTHFFERTLQELSEDQRGKIMAELLEGEDSDASGPGIPYRVLVDALERYQVGQRAKEVTVLENDAGPRGADRGPQESDED